MKFGMPEYVVMPSVDHFGSVVSPVTTAEKEYERLQAECDRLNVGLPEDSEMEWAVRVVWGIEPREPTRTVKNYNKD